MSSVSLSINLLKNKQVGFFGEFINWTLTIGRLVIIITELIALSAFLYRFSLDRKLIDLQSQIKEKQTIISSLKSNTAEYLDLQERLYLASKFSLLSMERHKILTDILNLTPQDITLSRLSLDKNGIQIDADLQNLSSLIFFVNSLKNYPSIDALNLGSIDNKLSANLITVGITATLKKSQYEDVKQ
jgi:hypothetical protein